MTLNVSPPIVAVAPGNTGSVNVDVQRMADDVGGYSLAGVSPAARITTTPVSGRFASDGSSAVTVPITVERSVPDGYYFVYLTAKTGEYVRRATVLVMARAESDGR